MANPLLPPNPCLLGILLVTRFDSDPNVTFHYPPRLGEDDSWFSKYFACSFEDGTTSSSDDEISSSSDDEARTMTPNPKPEAEDRAQHPEVDEAGSVSPEKREGMATPQRHTNWDDLLGYSSSVMAKFLCPAPSTHKKKFEVALDDEVFLGWPVFAKEDGRWRRTRRRRPKTRINNEDLDRGSATDDSTIALQEAGDPNEMSEAEKNMIATEIKLPKLEIEHCGWNP